MPIRFQRKRQSLAQNNFQSHQVQVQGARQIQRLIKPQVHLSQHSICKCAVCLQQKPLIHNQKQQVKEFKQSSKRSHQWLKKILVGLTQKATKTLKLYLPDTLFITGDGLQIFSTNKKDYRMIKFAGTTPIKALYSTVTRLIKQYKGMLQENFRKSMIDKIDPLFMHVKYYDKLLLSHFHEGEGSKTLSQNKHKFKHYILHKNQKYIISSIQQHKMNQKQPFCTIRYCQGNSQLLNQKQFQMFSLIKLPQDIVYIQSFVKSKDGQAISYGSYTQGTQLDQKLWKWAELQVMVLIGGIGKYDHQYQELENFQDSTDQLMKESPDQYALLMTYKIIHFLSMVANVYIRHIKIRWIINDIANVYLQQIIQFDTQQISKRSIRYKMPPSKQLKHFYQDSDFFIEIHRQMKRKKQQSLRKIQKQLKQQNGAIIIQNKQNPQKQAQVVLMNLYKKNDHSFLKSFTKKKLSKRQSISIDYQKPLYTSRRGEQIAVKPHFISNRYSSIKDPQSTNANLSSINSHNNKFSISKRSIDQSRRSISAFDTIGSGRQILTKEKNKRWNQQDKRYANKSYDKNSKNNFTYNRQQKQTNTNMLISWQFNQHNIKESSTINFS